jgi:prolipoprotein diacylglyceryltransferase
LFHPVFFYEAVWNIIGVFVLLAIDRRLDLQWGRHFSLYLIWYGVGRATIETIRLDPSETFAGIRVNVWASFAAILLGALLFYIQGRRHPGSEPSPYLDGRVWVDPKTLDSNETFTKAELVSADGSQSKRRVATSGTRKR